MTAVSAFADHWKEPSEDHVPTVLLLVRHELYHPQPGTPSQIYVVAGLGNCGASCQNTRHNSGRLVLRELARSAIGNEYLYSETRRKILNMASHQGQLGKDYIAPSAGVLASLREQSFVENTQLRFGDDSVETEMTVYKSEPISFRSNRGEIFLEYIGDRLMIYVAPFYDINESGVFVASVVNFLNQSKTLVTPQNLYVLIDDMDLDFGKMKLSTSSSKGHGATKSLIQWLPQPLQKFQRLRFGIGRPAEGTNVISHVLGDWNRGESLQVHSLVKEAATIVSGHVQEQERLRLKRMPNLSDGEITASEAFDQTHCEQAIKKITGAS